MTLIGYLYGIEYKCRLEQEVRVNIAYRWFLGIELDEPVPDHSTISQLHRRKFSGTTIFQDIFDEIVRKCMTEGLVTGKLSLTDSTHIRANAQNDLREVIEIPDTPIEYMQKLDREAYEMRLIQEPVEYDSTKTKEIIKSITDPDCCIMNRKGKPQGFHYLSHQTCDSENGIITDVLFNAGNVRDCTPHTERIEHQIDKFGFETEAVCADAGYDNREIHEAMHTRNVMTYIPQTEPYKLNANYEKSDFQYDKERYIYICPAGKMLKYSNYSKK